MVKNIKMYKTDEEYDYESKQREKEEEDKYNKEKMERRLGIILQYIDNKYIDIVKETPQFFEKFFKDKTLNIDEKRLFFDSFGYRYLTEKKFRDENNGKYIYVVGKYPERRYFGVHRREMTNKIREETGKNHSELQIIIIEVKEEDDDIYAL